MSNLLAPELENSGGDGLGVSFSGKQKKDIQEFIQQELKALPKTTAETVKAAEPSAAQDRVEKPWIVRNLSHILTFTGIFVAIGLSVWQRNSAVEDIHNDEHIRQLARDETQDLRADIKSIRAEVASIKGQLEILRPLVEKQVAQNLRNTAEGSAAAPTPGSINPAIVKSAGLQLLQSGNTKAAAIAVNYISHTRASQNGMDFSKLSRCVVGKPGGLIEISGGVLRNCVFDIQGRASYVNATFINCVIKYYGAPTTFKNVTFQNCYFIIVRPTERRLPTEQEFLREALNNPQGFTLNSSG